METEKALKINIKEPEPQQTNYWTKKNTYKEERTHINTIDIYNQALGQWETIKLSDYLNSYVDLTPGLQREEQLKQLNKQAKLIKEEITKVQNISNITDNENQEAEQIWKIKQYLKEKEAELEAKKKGEN